MLRRLPLSIPLAVVVALLAHTAAFGSSHAFGGVTGFSLIAASVAALVLAAILTPAVIALSARRISPKALLAFAVRLGGEITVGGVAVYAGMEHLEGHAPELLPCRTLALLGAGLLTLAATMLGACGLTQVGYALAAALRAAHVRRERVSRFAPRVLALVRSSCVCAPSLGRAPPLRA